MSVEKAGSFKQVALRGTSNACPEVDDNVEEFEAAVMVEDFKQDFFGFGKVDIFNRVPQRGDFGCISVAEFSTDLDDEAKMLLCCRNCNTTEAELLVSLSEIDPILALLSTERCS